MKSACTIDSSVGCHSDVITEIRGKGGGVSGAPRWPWVCETLWRTGGVALWGVWGLGRAPHSFVWKMGVRSQKWGRAQKDFQQDVGWPGRTLESQFNYVILRISGILFFKCKKIYFIVSNIFQINHLKALTINNHLYSSGTFLLKSSKHFTFIISLSPNTVPVGKVISILTFKCLPFRIPQAYINSIPQNVNVHWFYFTVSLAGMCITHLSNSLNVPVM